MLHPETVYSLGVKLQVDEWPVWADRLDLELVGGWTSPRSRMAQSLPRDFESRPAKARALMMADARTSQTLHRGTSSHRQRWRPGCELRVTGVWLQRGRDVSAQVGNDVGEEPGISGMPAEVER